MRLTNSSDGENNILVLYLKLVCITTSNVPVVNKFVEPLGLTISYIKSVVNNLFDDIEGLANSTLSPCTLEISLGKSFLKSSEVK